jgi:hypothetical protein
MAPPPLDVERARRMSVEAASAHSSDDDDDDDDDDSGGGNPVRSPTADGFFGWICLAARRSSV